MHRLFGKSVPKAPAPTINDASSNIGVKIEEMDVKIKGLEDEMRKYSALLKKTPNNATVRKRAADCLKRKRMYEQQRDQFASQQFNIDQTAFAIETVKNTQESVSAMKVAAKTLKKETKKLSISEIEDMQDEMEDMLEDVGEINEILGRTYGCPEGVEEDDLDAELAMMEDDMFADEEVVADSSQGIESSSFTAPSVPTMLPHFSGTEPAPETVFNSTATKAETY